MSIYVPAEEVVVPYGASHIETAERITHIMRKTKNDIEMLQDAEFYVDTDLGEPQTFFTDLEKKKAKVGTPCKMTTDTQYMRFTSITACPVLIRKKI